MPVVITGTSVQTSSLSAGINTSPGTVTGTWTLTSGSTWESTFADLAEYYDGDQDYEPGTVLVFGGTEEVTISTRANDSRVAGAVSTNPAYILNAGREGIQVIVALQGKAPIKVVGPVNKGDMLVTASVPGYAAASATPGAGMIIGKALEDKLSDEPGLILVAVGRL